MGACHLWGINKYGQESACDCEMVVTLSWMFQMTRDFCLYPWIVRTGFSEGGLGVKKVRPIRGDLQNPVFLLVFPLSNFTKRLGGNIGGHHALRPYLANYSMINNYEGPPLLFYQTNSRPSV